MSRFTTLLLLLGLIVPMMPQAYVASDSRRPDLSREQIVARIKRAESQLANGRPSVAIQTIWRVIEEFAGVDRMMSFTDGFELGDRSRQLHALAIVRIPKTDRYFKGKDRAEELFYAKDELSFHVKERGTALDIARYGEALVASAGPDELRQAFELLLPLFRDDSIIEPEALVALSRAACAIGEEGVAEEAFQRCRERVGKRVQRCRR